MDTHVQKWIIVNRREIFKEVAEFGDMVRKYFPNARTEWAEESGRTIGTKLEGRAHTWK
jgi:hypothetical protein